LHVIVRRETTPKDRLEGQRWLRLGNQTGIRFHFGAGKELFPTSIFTGSKVFTIN